jgi:hypothetical protein
MSTPQDQQRTAAFRAWLKHIGSIDVAQATTGIKPRSLERFRSGKEPPPVRLLAQLAEIAERDGLTDLGAILRGAAAPEVLNA